MPEVDPAASSMTELLGDTPYARVLDYLIQNERLRTHAGSAIMDATGLSAPEVGEAIERLTQERILLESAQGYRLDQGNSIFRSYRAHETVDLQQKLDAAQERYN